MSFLTSNNCQMLSPAYTHIQDQNKLPIQGFPVVFFSFFFFLLIPSKYIKQNILDPCTRVDSELPNLPLVDTVKVFEPWRDKTNKLSVCPAKTRISLCAEWVDKDPSFLHAGSEDWLDWVDTQADLSLRWVHTHFVGFFTRRLILSLPLAYNYLKMLILMLESQKAKFTPRL